MTKYAITINEMVLHQHKLVIECESQDDAELLANVLDDDEFDSVADMVIQARMLGAKVCGMDEDYAIETDNIEIDEVEEWEI